MVTDGDGGLGAIGERATTGVGGERTLAIAGCTTERTTGVVRLTGSGLDGLPRSSLPRLTGSGLGGKCNETVEGLGATGSVVGTEGSTINLGEGIRK